MSRNQTMTFQDDLIARFQKVCARDGIPEWAWQFKPSVPLIGARYQPGRSLLVYASAENLKKSNTGGKEAPRFSPPSAWNRYRKKYEQHGRGSKDFFPKVGIAPVNDGALLAAALYIAERLGLPTCGRPRAFLETLAVGNWCKFSIYPSSTDYVDALVKLECSLPYVEAELSLLKPRVVHLPHRVWKHPSLRKCMQQAAPTTSFLPLPQFQPTVVNCHLDAYHRRGQALCAQMGGTALPEWMQHLRCYKTENAWRYMAKLESVISVSSPVRSVAPGSRQ